MKKLILALALTMLTSVASASYSKIINCKTMAKTIIRVIHTDGIDIAAYTLKRYPRSYVCAMTDYDGDGSVDYVAVSKDDDDGDIIELSISYGKAKMDIYELTCPESDDYCHHQVRTLYHTGIESKQGIDYSTYLDKRDNTIQFINGL